MYLLRTYLHTYWRRTVYGDASAAEARGRPPVSSAPLHIPIPPITSSLRAGAPTLRSVPAADSRVLLFCSIPSCPVLSGPVLSWALCHIHVSGARSRDSLLAFLRPASSTAPPPARHRPSSTLPPTVATDGDGDGNGDHGLLHLLRTVVHEGRTPRTPYLDSYARSPLSAHAPHPSMDGWLILTACRHEC
jgi:hypothetical protein